MRLKNKTRAHIIEKWEGGRWDLGTNFKNQWAWWKTYLNLIYFSAIIVQKSKSDMVGTNNDVKALIGVSRNFQHLVQKNLNTVFRSIYNFKTDNNRQMLCATRKQNSIRFMNFFLNLTYLRWIINQINSNEVYCILYCENFSRLRHI